MNGGDGGPVGRPRPGTGIGTGGLVGAVVGSGGIAANPGRPSGGGSAHRLLPCGAVAVAAAPTSTAPLLPTVRAYAASAADPTADTS